MPNHNAALSTDALAATANHYASVDALLSAHGLRRTQAARVVLAWLLANPDTSYTHAQLQLATQDDQALALDRVTLYRLIDRLTQVGLLLCRVDANRVRRYQAMPASVQALPHFECQTCHRDQPFTSALQSNTNDLEKAAQTALQALKALGYQGLSMDFAVRGVCADCATETPGAVVVNPTEPLGAVVLRSIETPGAVVISPTELPGVQPAPAELPNAAGA